MAVFYLYKTYTWEQRKLGDLANIRRGASPRPIQDPKWFDNDSHIGWLRISDVTEQKGRITSLEQKLSVLGQEKTLVLREPNLILSITATVGKPVINYIPTGIHDGFIVFLDLKTDMEFMYQWLESYQSQWQKFGQPGSQVNINSDLEYERKRKRKNSRAAGRCPLILFVDYYLYKHTNKYRCRKGNCL